MSETEYIPLSLGQGEIMGKVLILANSSSGLYGFRNELVLELLKEHEVYASLPDETNNKELMEEGCKVIKTEFNRRGMNPAKDIKLFFTYLDYLKKIKPDVVLLYTIKPNLYGGLACRLKKIPYISNITGLGTTLQRDTLLSRGLLAFYRISTKKATRVFFQNRSNLDFMQEKGIALKNAAMLPGSGVNLTENAYQEYPSEEDGIQIFAVLRIMKDKGIEEFLTAVEKISEKYPKCRFVLAGEYEAETKGKYRPWVEHLEEKGALKHLGYIMNVKEVMGQSHIIVHPSYHEGLSNVLLEAAACGRPILASDVPGCRETLQNGISGELFTSQSADELIASIEKMLSYTEEKRRMMGKYGRKYVEDHYDRAIVVEKYRDELKKIQAGV